MRNTTAIPLLFLLSAISLTAQTPKGAPATASTGWQTLMDSAFQISYPGSWTLDRSGATGARFMLFSPQDSPTDPFKENINLQVTDLGAPGLITLDLFGEAAESQIKQYITNAKVLKSGHKSRELAGSDYYELIFTGNQGDLALQWKQHYWLKGRYVYILTFTAQQSTYAQYLSAADKVLSTFDVQ